MRRLAGELIPHAPHLGLFVAPEIPEDKLRNAIRDYARSVDPSEVIVLFDSTLLGSAKDGAIFTADRLVFQNNDLESTHDVRYEDIVHVESKRKLIGGKRIILGVNRGRATFQIEMDFSGRPDAAEYILRFLREAMVATELHSADRTDVKAVRKALEELHTKGLLSSTDLSAMFEVLDRKAG